LRRIPTSSFASARAAKSVRGLRGADHLGAGFSKRHGDACTKTARDPSDKGGKKALYNSTSHISATLPQGRTQSLVATGFDSEAATAASL